MPRSILDDMRAAGANPEIMAQLEAQLAPVPSAQAAPATSAPVPGQLPTAHPLFGLLLASAAVYCGKPKLDVDEDERLTVYLDGSLRVRFDLKAHQMQYLVGKYTGKLRPVNPLGAHERSGLVDILSGATFVS